ncbi:gas vesicle protein [Saccharopolyspora rhizosphaerae]|uniref:Gas vesicle protein n=1 Tax=Saccharopolyspora rhizosphaerae TaxID=2492662 RepID=A0A426JZY3_9PSEU|nr:gas vesicle protein GvpG [Saccharopolyspora rhizosphaerae]RRO18717.1 gas vesicle protein [Saccharopolyspora rhizosphaerae]
MGLLKEVFLLPLAPVRGVGWTVEQLLDAAEREQVRNIRAELVQLEQDLQEGLISEDEFDAREDELLDRLDELEAGLSDDSGTAGRDG